jgi:AcrR family transcriptional regulator
MWTGLRSVYVTADHCSTQSGPRSGSSILAGVSVTVPTVQELPVIEEEPPLRADAARNRDKVLAAAERLFAEHGTCVTMDAVAAEAGVGKGTLFRGFGDRAGLIMAMLSEHERRLQEDVIRGPAPLGPGAPPVERLIAFGERLAEHFGRHGELIAAAEASAGVRYSSAPFAFYRTHVATLVRDADPFCDWDYIADALMAALRVDHLRYLGRIRGMDHERVAAGWEDLVRRLFSDR